MGVIRGYLLLHYDLPSWAPESVNRLIKSFARFGARSLLEASLLQMRKACLKNLKAAGALHGSHDSGKGMLLFYSSECGLKHLIMKDRGQKTTAIVAGEYGHTIRAMIAAARISRSELAQSGNGVVMLPQIRKKGSGDAISLSEFHTAMRYGIDLENDDEAKATYFFDELASALKKRIFSA